MAGTGPGKRNHPVGTAFQRPERLQLPGHTLQRPVMLVGRIVAGGVDNGVAGAEAREGVHVGVGIIPGQVSGFQPQNALSPEF